MNRFFKIALVAAALAAPVVTVGVASAEEGKASCCKQADGKSCCGESCAKCSASCCKSK